MASVSISSSSLFGSKLPINISSAALSSPHRFSFNLKKVGAFRITCDHSCFEIKGVSYRPPGTEIDLLNGVSFSIPEKRSKFQSPDLLILDEPLAGLDWKARADVVKLLKDLKKELAVLVVSHDLKELAPIVDQSWRMEMNGVLKRECLPI